MYEKVVDHDFFKMFSITTSVWSKALQAILWSKMFEICPQGLFVLFWSLLFCFVFIFCSMYEISCCLVLQHLQDMLELDMSALSFMMKCFPEIKEVEDMRKSIGRYGLTGKQQVCSYASSSLLKHTVVERKNSFLENEN